MTEPTTTTPEVPAWLNIDELDPAGLREEVRTVLALLVDVHEQIEPVAERAVDLLRRIDVAEDKAVHALEEQLGEVDKDITNGVRALVCQILGGDDLNAVMTSVSETLSPENLWPAGLEESEEGAA